MKRWAVAIFLAGTWIGFSEFLRNQWLLGHYWTAHYAALGLTFPSSPSNGLVWAVWSWVFAGLLATWLMRFSFRATILMGWVAGFVLMWLVIGNLAVLPWGILPIALPWSFFEVTVAVAILRICLSTHKKF